MKQYLFYFLAYILLFSCSSEEEVVHYEKKDYPVIWGELSPFDSIHITLQNVNNRSYPNYKSKKMFSNARVFNQKNKTTEILSKRDSINWSSAYFPKENLTYELQVIWDGKLIKITTQIPKKFLASATKTNKNNHIAIRLKIENTLATHSYYIINCKNRSNNEFLNINCNDASLDNIKYNELERPYKYLFLQANKKEIVLNFEIPESEAYFSNPIQLIVKKVNLDLYDFLYSYELQKQDEENIIQNTGKDFIGIWSGYYPIHIDL